MLTSFLAPNNFVNNGKVLMVLTAGQWDKEANGQTVALVKAILLSHPNAAKKKEIVSSMSHQTSIAIIVPYNTIQPEALISVSQPSHKTLSLVADLDTFTGELKDRARTKNVV